MATKDWNGFKKSGDTYIPNDATARADITAIKDGTNIDSFGDVETALAGKADKFGVDGLTIDWLQGVGIPDKLYVMEHDEIPQEGTESSGLPNDEAIRKAVGSAYNLMKDTVGWTGLNKLPYTLDELKTVNTTGTWVGNVYTLQNVSFTINSDLSVTVAKSGELTSTSIAFNFSNYKKYLETGKSYKLKGCDGGSNTTYKYDILRQTGQAIMAACYNGEVLFTETEDSDKARIVVYKTASDFTTTIKPMIYDANILSPTYEPYRGTTAFPRDEQRVLGAKNRCPVPDKTETSRSVTYAMVKKTGIVTANGTVDTGTTSYGSIYNRTNSPLILPANKYKMKCDFIAQTGVNVTFLCTRNGASYTYGSVNSSNDIIEADILEGDTIGISIVCSSGTVLDNKTFAPMIWLASDPDDTYVPYAMTNRELTENKVDKVGREITSSDDADNLDSAGRYYWKSTKPANIPTDASTYSYMEVYAGTGTIKQIIYSGTNTIYMRIKSGSPLTWKTWYKFEGTVVS